MLQSVVGVHSLVVDGEGPRSDAPLVLSCRVGPEFPRKHVENFLTDPPSFGERCKREVVRVHFPEAWN